jgi:hypothetical protein
MKWLWNNDIFLIQFGAAVLGFGIFCAALSSMGLGPLFHIAYSGSFTVGGILFLCGSIIFCLRFGVKSAPKTVMGLALSVQALMAIPFFLHSWFDYHLRLYLPLVRLMVSGLWFLTLEMAALLLLIGLIRFFFYNPLRS